MRLSKLGSSVFFIALICLTSNLRASAQCRSLPELYEKLSPSVVLVKSEYFRIDDYTKQISSKVITGTGSFITPDGLILTTDHVFNPKINLYDSRNYYEYAFKKTSIMYRGREYQAKVVSIDPDFFVALIKLDNPSNELFPAVSIAKPGNLRVGDCIILIGNPNIYRNILKTNVVSGFSNVGLSGNNNSNDGIYTSAIFIMSNLGVDHGDSGGPVFDQLGQLVGVTNYLGQKSFSGVVLIDKFVEDLIKHAKNDQKLQRAFFNASFLVDEPSGEIDLSLLEEEFSLGDQIHKKEALRIPVDLKIGIVLYSPKQLGFTHKDVIVEFNDKSVVNVANFLRMVAEASIDKSAKFKVYRDGKLIEFYATLEVRQLVNTK